MASDLTEQLALGNMEPPPPYVIQEEHSVQTSCLTGSKQTAVDEQRSRAASGEPNWLASSTSEVMIRTARSCTSLNEGKKSSSNKSRPPFLRTHTRISIREKQGRSNSRIAIGGYKYSLSIEPEIQPVTSINTSNNQLDIEECRDDLGDLEQVTQKGGSEKTESFFTKYKLERGSLTAFKREARNIIERDLPLILHRDNIIKVWTDRGQPQLLTASAASRNCFDKFSEKFKYWFQHPYLRLLVCYLIIPMNFLVFAEDPVSHSRREADIPVVGQVFSFVITKYPLDWRYCFLKVFMWLLAVGCGMVVGKIIIHGIILSRFLRLKMFRADQGSWMVQFLTVIISLYLFSNAYNVLLIMTYPKFNETYVREYKNESEYIINSKLGVSNASIMKAAATGTWLGTLITALIVTDMMLQDNLYPNWAPSVRKFWKTHGWVRIGVFWFGSAISTAVVIMVITTDWITWDRINRDFISTSELSRAFLCSSVLVMDLVIVMQDWDFPHFTNTLDVLLPGLHKHVFSIELAEVQISGKWFNYGIIFFVMIFDLNMWKNQMFYKPENYGQYIGTQFRVFTVTNETILQMDDPYLWSYAARSQPDPDSFGIPFLAGDEKMYSKFCNYPMAYKALAFIPSVSGFIMFFSLIAIYGRIQTPNSHSNGNERVEL